jgi:hypothetical protein
MDLLAEVVRGMGVRIPVEYDAATGRKRRCPAKDTMEAAPSPAERGTVAGAAAANMETAAALHAMARTLLPTASTSGSVERFVAR